MKRPSSKRELWAAVEGGGSKTRILLARPEGDILARETGPGASPLYLRPKTYARALSARLERIAFAAEETGGRVTAVGVAAPMDLALVETCLRKYWPRARLVRTSESAIVFAQHDLRAGVALIAGTGSSCEAINERGRRAAAGGWGPQFGDEGSGYWIARKAVTAVLRARDGRGPATLLDERFRQFFGIENPWRVFKQCDASGHVSVPRVARFAADVFEAAREGDAVARRICAAAARAQAELIAAALERAPLRKRPIPVALSGGVFHAGPLIIKPLERALRARGLDAQIYPPLTEPAEGIFKVMAQELR